MTALTAYLAAACFVAPGIAGWADLRARFASGAWDRPEAWGSVWTASPDCFPPRQARRLSPEIRLAAAAAEVIAPALPPEAAWVFGSSAGEGHTLAGILDELREPDMLIQPLKFQNAVHNAPSGHWSIAAGHAGPMTSIAAYDGTFAAALLKAVVQMRAEARPAGVVVYDAPFPVPLDEKRPMEVSLAAGLALSPEAAPGSALRLTITVDPGEASPPATPTGRALLATGNPVGRAAALLEAIAAGEGGAAIHFRDGAPLRIDVERL